VRTYLFASGKCYISTVEHFELPARPALTMRLESRPMSCTKSGTYSILLYSFVLLLATFAQALDSCEFAQLGIARQVSADQSVRSGPTICLVCAAAHATPLPAPICSTYVPVRMTTFPSTSVEGFASVLKPFALHVRPPPGSSRLLVY
jgi:hypothetical protein